MYSKAAPWQVQVPCPVPTRNRWRSPRRMRATAASRAAAAAAAWGGVQTERLWPFGPRPGVASKASLGPVALTRKS